MALYDAPGSSGADICKVTALPSGTVYPILSRLDQAKWVRSNWESGTSTSLGRPRRRFYQLTGVGAAEARTVASEVASLYAKFAR